MRIELTAQISDAIRDLLAPCGDTLARPAGGDLERGARILKAAGLRLADPVGAGRSHRVWLEPGTVGDRNLVLAVDVTASDLSHIATWRPVLAPAGASTVLSQAGLGSNPPATLLEACSRWVDALVQACDANAAAPFEARILAWPVVKGDVDPHVIDRYIAGGPGAQEFARTQAQERQEILAQLRPPPVRTFGPGSQGARALEACLARRAADQEMHCVDEARDVDQAPARERLAA